MLPMSWKETCPMNERVRFIGDLLVGERSMSELCTLYGVSRKTGYKWLARYEAAGASGLEDRSHAPLQQALSVDAALVQRLLQARCQHPSWGPRKLLVWLQTRHPTLKWPAASTVGEILCRHGLVSPRKRTHKSPAHQGALINPDAPNVLWCTDFKGQFRTGDARYCYPLTLTDAFSRYLLVCRGVLIPDTASVWRWFERAFQEHGLPMVMRSDNGPPFASKALGGLSHLSVWWIKLGIMPERISPGCPQQNGRHERMHRTLKHETTRPAAASLRAQQRAFDHFVTEYNDERPHEALGQRPPSSVYRGSPRAYPRRVPHIEYPDSYTVRQVRYNGEVKWHGHLVYVSQVLPGEAVGFYQIDEHTWRVYFGMLQLGLLDTRTHCITSAPKQNAEATH
jgi:transposase InsO family protein